LKKNILPIVVAMTLIASASLCAEGAGDALRQVQQYNFSINILAMLLVGFGFLMVFVKKYGYSATTGTFLVVAVGLPLYFLLRSKGILAAEAIPADNVRALLLAEFAVASTLIAMGAVLGRLKAYQYAIVAALMVPLYMLNEWMVLDGGLGREALGFSFIRIWSSQTGRAGTKPFLDAISDDRV
jgi:ammonium transporter Rh